MTAASLSLSPARAGRALSAGLLAMLASCSQPAQENKPAQDSTSAGNAQARQAQSLEAPYVGSPDELFFDCFHISISEWRCPDTGPGESFSAANIASTSVTYTLKDGRTVTRTLPPDADALFLTRGAARTFLLRYYKATAPEKAAALEKRLEQPTAK